MFKTLGLMALLSVVLACGTLMAQQGQNSPAPLPPQAGMARGMARTMGRSNMQVCMQRAGISKTIMQQHRTMMQSMRSQLRSACTDSSLTQQQRMEKIRQIRQSMRSQMMGQLTAQQRQAMQQCMRQNNRRGGRGMARRSGGGNPCAQFGGASGAVAPGPSCFIGFIFQKYPVQPLLLIELRFHCALSVASKIDGSFITTRGKFAGL